MHSGSRSVILNVSKSGYLLMCSEYFFNRKYCKYLQCTDLSLFLMSFDVAVDSSHFVGGAP